VTRHRIFTTRFAAVHPHLVAKAERKGRSKDEVDEIIRWLTGYSREGPAARLADGTDFETFLAAAPRTPPANGRSSRTHRAAPEPSAVDRM
jgi:hypothetical protein